MVRINRMDPRDLSICVIDGVWRGYQGALEIAGVRMRIPPVSGDIPCCSRLLGLCHAAQEISASGILGLVWIPVDFTLPTFAEESTRRKGSFQEYARASLMSAQSLPITSSMS